MTKEIIDPQIEEDKLKQCQMFTNRGFMVTITKSDGTALFYPHMISNFSIDTKKIFITIYDLIQALNVEEELDELSKGFCFFKKNVKITLHKLDPMNEEVYRIEYNKCKLKKYHGKNFTYKANDPHQWYLEFTFSSKNVIKNKNYIFNSGNNTPKLTKSDYKKMAKKEIAILQNSNKMLEEAADKVRGTHKLNQSQKNERITNINSAKTENETVAMKYYGKTLQDVDFDEIEKTIETQITKIENKIYK